MPDKPKDQQQTEQTPKGLTVPVPKREDFFANLKKVAEPAKKPKKDAEIDSSPYGENWSDQS